MKKKFLLLTLAAAVTAFFAGCGDDSSTGSSKGSSGSDTDKNSVLDQPCDEDYEGATLLFKSSKDSYKCVDGEWIPVSSSSDDEDSDDEETAKSSASSKSSTSESSGDKPATDADKPAADEDKPAKSSNSIFDDEDDDSEKSSSSAKSSSSGKATSEETPKSSATVKSSASTKSSSSVASDDKPASSGSKPASSADSDKPSMETKSSASNTDKPASSDGKPSESTGDDKSSNSSNEEKPSTETKSSSSVSSGDEDKPASGSLAGKDCSEFGTGAIMTKNDVSYTCDGDVWTETTTGDSGEGGETGGEGGDSGDGDNTETDPMNVWVPYDDYKDGAGACVATETQSEVESYEDFPMLSLSVVCNGYNYDAYGGAGINLYSEPTDITEWDGICVEYSTDEAVKLSIIPFNEKELTGYDDYGIPLNDASETVIINRKWTSFSRAGWEHDHEISMADFLKYTRGFKVQYDGWSGANIRILRIGKWGDCGPVSDADKLLAEQEKKDAENKANEKYYDIESYFSGSYSWDYGSSGARIETGFDDGDDESGYWFYDAGKNAEISFPYAVGSEFGDENSINDEIMDYCRGICGQVKLDAKAGAYTFVGFNMVNSSLGGADMKAYGGIQVAYVSTDMPMYIVLVPEDYATSDLYYMASLPATGENGLTEVDIPWSEFYASKETEVSVEDFVKKVAAIHVQFMYTGTATSTSFNLRAIGWGYGEGSEIIHLPGLNYSYQWNESMGSTITTNFGSSDWSSSSNGAFVDIDCGVTCGTMGGDKPDGFAQVGFNLVDAAGSAADLSDVKDFKVAYALTTAPLYLVLVNNKYPNTDYRATLSETGEKDGAEVTVNVGDFSASSENPSVDLETSLKDVSSIQIRYEGENSTRFVIRGFEIEMFVCKNCALSEKSVSEDGLMWAPATSARVNTGYDNGSDVSGYWYDAVEGSASVQYPVSRGNDYDPYALN